MLAGETRRAIRCVELRSWPKRDERELRDEAAAIVFRAAISPVEQTAQNRADDRCHEPMAPLVAADHPHSLRLAKQAVGGNETLPSDDDLRAGRRLDVAEPIGLRSEAAHDHRFGTVAAVFHDFQNGLSAQPGAAPGMSEEQEPVSEKPAAPAAVQPDRCPQKAPKRGMQTGHRQNRVQVLAGRARRRSRLAPATLRSTAPRQWAAAK